MVLLLLPTFFVVGGQADHNVGVVFAYMHDQLLVLSKIPLLPGVSPVIPVGLKRRCWGCRARVKLRARRQQYKPSVTLIIMGSMRSLGNKIDELCALIKTQREFRESSIYGDMAARALPGPQGLSIFGLTGTLR